MAVRVNNFLTCMEFMREIILQISDLKGLMKKTQCENYYDFLFVDVDL